MLLSLIIFLLCYFSIFCIKSVVVKSALTHFQYYLKERKNLWTFESQEPQLSVFARYGRDLKWVKGSSEESHSSHIPHPYPYHHPYLYPPPLPQYIWATVSSFLTHNLPIPGHTIRHEWFLAIALKVTQFQVLALGGHKKLLAEFKQWQSDN